MASDDRGLVAPSDIAEMVGVSRAAVSNWRRRATGFPEPTGGSVSKPLFDRGEVTAWLQANGKTLKSDAGEQTLWSTLNSLRDRWSVDEMAEVVLALACVRKLSAKTGDGDAWAQLTEAPPGNLQPLRALGSAVADIDAPWQLLVGHEAEAPLSRVTSVQAIVDALDAVKISELGRVVDYVLARVGAAKGRMEGQHGLVESKVSSILGQVARQFHPADDAVIYDPACGIGGALLEAADQLTWVDVVGHDINAGAARRSAQRAFLHDVDLRTVVADVLDEDPEPTLRADVVVLEPPFGMRFETLNLADPRWRFGTPPKSSSELAWIQHAIFHLTDRGRAFVITPMGALLRGGAEQRIRTELLQSGCVETIVALPGKLLPHTAIPLALWVLRTPDPLADDVRMVDGTEFTDLEEAVPAWCIADDDPNPKNVPNRRVTISDLLASGADLTPQRWTDVSPSAPTDLAETYLDGWRAMIKALEDVAGSGGSLRHFAENPQSRIFTVGELIDEGVLSLKAGKKRTGLRSHLVPYVVEASDVKDGYAHLGTDADVAELADHPDLTHEGDVLVTTMNHIRTMVDESGGHLPAAGVYRLRVEDRAQLDPTYLATMLRGSWNAKFQSGTTIQRARIRDLEVPLISREAQRNFYLATVAVNLLKQRAAELAEHASVVEQSLLDAVRFNVALDEPLA